MPRALAADEAVAALVERAARVRSGRRCACESANIASNPPMPTGVTVASAPPATMTSHLPRRIHSLASPMAWAPLEHALVVQ